MSNRWFQVRDGVLEFKLSRIRSAWLRVPAVLLSSPLVLAGNLVLHAWMVVLVVVSLCVSCWHAGQSAWRVMRGAR